jgi:hypothetical protein
MKGKTMRYLSILLLLGSATLVAADELLEDPGFELATSGGQESNSAWVLTVNYPDGVQAAAQFMTAAFASNPNGTPGTGIWLRSYLGEVDPGDGTADAEIRQDVPGTEGVEYTMSAWFKKESNYTAAATRIGIVFLDGAMTILDTSEVDVQVLHPGDGSWIEYPVIATAPAGTAVVRVFGEMVGGSNSSVNPQSAFFDDFSLTGDFSVPIEAVSWARLKNSFR